MDRIIEIIELKKMRNETHTEFHEEVNHILVKYNAEISGITPLYSHYQIVLDHERESLDIIRKSSITTKIMEQDQNRDVSYRGFFDTIKGATNHFNAEHREAARMLSNTFKHYGNIAKKTLNDETAAINNLITELRKPALYQALSLLGLLDWLDRLQYENDLFTELMRERYTEISQQTSYRMVETRKETDKYYHAIVNHIENLHLSEIPVNETFIKELNTVINSFKHILAQETAERKKSPNETETEINTETETETEIETEIENETDTDTDTER
ncbi:MAG: DUF6261 family protein [Bacteroidales bacterium]|jgi:hypothetical protein|nr:DUF6261 family protein [Bacteroidales bacterium]